MSNTEMINNDVVTLICSVIVVVLSVLIYKQVRGIGWLLMVVSWCYMLVLRSVWLYDTLCRDFDIKAELGSLVYPHWIIVVIALFIFYFDIKKILKR